MKRFIDASLAALALVALAPVLALIALMIRFRIGSPVIFRQMRPGLKGKPFVMFKFRTMTAECDPNGKLLPDELRLTKLGRFLRATSLDELPELYNVLRGEMSLVGPRPLLMEYLDRYTPEEARRHDVLPGITGLAQVSGRNSLAWEKKFELDVWYVNHQTTLLDIKILMKTIFKTLARTGINAAQHATMPKFNGRALVIVGAGGHAKVIIAAAQAMGERIEAVYDDDRAKWGTEILGIPVIGGTDLIRNSRGLRAVIGVGHNPTRRKLAERLPDLAWETIVHPAASVHPSATIGAGTVIFAGTQIQPDCRIGAHSIVNTGASIDHDCVVGDFAHIGPGVNLCGAVEIQAGALMGVGSSVIPLKKVGAWTTVGAGSAVVEDLPPDSTAVGTPARVIKTHARSAQTPILLPAPKGESALVGASEAEIPMASADLDESDVKGVLEVVRSGRLALGPKVPAFERAIADYVGVKHAIAVSSGTAALHLIVKSLGIGPGDEVLVPSFTFAASVNAILFEGAKPVFVDADPLTFNIDPADMDRKCGPRTKAVMVVDVFGHPAPWKEILAVAKKRNLRIIDDSCEALGARYHGKAVGSFGDAAAFAFYPNKQITTGEGGILVTNDDEIARLSRSYRNQGRNEMGHWLEHARLGYNYRMDEMSGALGCSQMARLDQFLEKRSRVADLYTDRLTNLGWVRPPVVLPNVKMSWFVYVVSLELGDGLTRDDVIQGLQAKGIPARAYFSPIHEQSYLIGEEIRGGDSLPVTNAIAQKTLALPFFNNMTVAQVDRVVAALKEVVGALQASRRKAA